MMWPHLHKSGSYPNDDKRDDLHASANPSFNPDKEFAKDPIYIDIPPVDNSLFAIARKLILESK